MRYRLPPRDPQVLECYLLIPSRYYRNYQHTVQPYYSFLLDPQELERRFGDFLQHLGENGIDPSLEQTLRQATFSDASWYGLMVAVLASGCQFSGDIEDRQLRTRVLG